MENDKELIAVAAAAAAALPRLYGESRGSTRWREGYAAVTALSFSGSTRSLISLSSSQISR